jgi:hypothetical protein
MFPRFLGVNLKKVKKVKAEPYKTYRIGEYTNGFTRRKQKRQTHL